MAFITGPYDDLMTTKTIDQMYTFRESNCDYPNLNINLWHLERCKSWHIFRGPSEHYIVPHSAKKNSVLQFVLGYFDFSAICGGLGGQHTHVAIDM